MNPRPKISMIVALGAKTRAIGKGPDLLWRISDDLKRFKELTTGHPIIMGRKTHESIGRPLPNRTNIIITRNATYTATGCLVCSSLEEAIKQASAIDSSEIFVIGGGEIYAQALPFTDRIYATLVESEATGDVFFPDYYSAFKKVLKKEERFDEKTGLKYSWVDLER